MNWVLCALSGYLVGTVNPSYLIGRLKKLDIRQNGSGNAGASNALILFGKIYGVACALLDIVKAAFAIWLCGKLFPKVTYSFSIAAVSCILGHIFPFYIRFRGGKGLACLGGAVLMFDWRVFLIMLAFSVIVALVTNYICFVPLTASVIFPIVYGVMKRNLYGAMILCISTVVIFYKHRENLVRIKNGTELRLSFLWKRKQELERIGIDTD